ncbi:hypothetical protein [Moritella sp. F3]|uniref:hypothetical protein n=1 Tax=Moritella sp. F3 TaxID=2718882 RepID=UPI0018E169B3|nr:hypothetical protein [Moritella sp. F3]GIC77132.1 hypothetical protein FMO001_18590 [Moritella sp. F1]GIC82251.1 hypothetical protein FMO003_25320 [Moritella sp. F3]
MSNEQSLRSPMNVTFILAIHAGKYQQRTKELLVIVEALNPNKAESIDSLIILLKEYFVEIESYARLPSVIKSKPVTDESLENSWLLSTALGTFKLLVRWLDCYWQNEILDQEERCESVDMFGGYLEAFIQDVKRTLKLCSYQ